MDRIHGTAEVQCTHYDKTALDALLQQGGGTEIEGGTLTEKVQTGAEYALARLFKKFNDADDGRWDQVLKKSRSGDANALESVDYQGEVVKHPVCSAILGFVGSERMLTGGFYAEITLTYDASIAQERGGRPFGIESLRPIQLSKRDALDALTQGRAKFSTDDWKRFLLRSIGLEPKALPEKAQDLVFLRMVQNTYSVSWLVRESHLGDLALKKTWYVAAEKSLSIGWKQRACTVLCI